MSEWISVEEKMPVRMGIAIVNLEGGYMFTAWYDGDKNWFLYPSDKPLLKTEKITHWMPLPEPPE